MSEEIKEYVDPKTVSEDEFYAGMIGMEGEKPDISQLTPIIYAPNTGDLQSGAVYPWRLSFGAEDDPNRAKVYNWEQVDDLAGIAPLWAGTYNGTIYLHAGDSAPEAAEDDNSDVTGALISDGNISSVWRNGAPSLPFIPVPMDMRDSMLKNANGQFRRLIWEPIALFDLAQRKLLKEENGKLLINRHTLWAVVEHPYVVFYTTMAPIEDSAYDNTAEPRWPYSYYQNVARENWNNVNEYGEQGIDGGFVVGWGDSTAFRYFSGYRLAPLPWQNGTGTLESEEDFMPQDGVREGQFYNQMPQYPCSRYLATFNDYRIAEALRLAYTQNGERQEYEKIERDVAKAAIVDTICKAAAESYSLDPTLMEEQGRLFPDGVQEGAFRQKDPPQFKIVFSLHLDEIAEANNDRWPHWLAMMACDSETTALTASACWWYNDFRPAEGWPEDAPEDLPAPDPNDPNDVPPSDEEDDDDDDSGGDGTGNDVYEPDDPDAKPEDDPPTPDDSGENVVTKGSGRFYMGSDGVTVSAKWVNKRCGYIFTIRLAEVREQGWVDYDINTLFFTENAKQTYDYPNHPAGAQTGLRMYYGLQSDAKGQITVLWESSGINNAADTLNKGVAVYGANPAQSNVDSILVFEPLEVTSSTEAETFCGNILKHPPFEFDPNGNAKGDYFIKRGWSKEWDSLNQKWVRVRYEKTFQRIRLSIRSEKVLKKYAIVYAENNAPYRSVVDMDEMKSCADPEYLQGHSDDIDGPKVEPSQIFGHAIKKTQSLPNLYGGFTATITAYYEPCSTTYDVSGSASWNSNPQPPRGDGLPQKFGNIEGTFNIQLPLEEEIFDISFKS